jgi:hypothetical protein
MCRTVAASREQVGADTFPRWLPHDGRSAAHRPRPDCLKPSTASHSSLSHCRVARIEP